MLPMAGSTSLRLGGGRSVDRKSHSLSSRIAILHTKADLVWFKALVHSERCRCSAPPRSI